MIPSTRDYTTLCFRDCDIAHDGNFVFKQPGFHVMGSVCFRLLQGIFSEWETNLELGMNGIFKDLFPLCTRWCTWYWWGHPTNSMFIAIFLRVGMSPSIFCSIFYITSWKKTLDIFGCPVAEGAKCSTYFFGGGIIFSWWFNCWFGSPRGLDSEAGIPRRWKGLFS